MFHSVGSSVYIKAFFDKAKVTEAAAKGEFLQRRHEFLRDLTYFLGHTIVHEVAHIVLYFLHSDVNWVRDLATGEPWGCHCDGYRCVMATTPPRPRDFFTFSYSWANCTQKAADNVIKDQYNLDNCLKRVPVKPPVFTYLNNAKDSYGDFEIEPPTTLATPLACGNGYLDPGEECDCLKRIDVAKGYPTRNDIPKPFYILPEEEWRQQPGQSCNPDCCDFNTCKLKTGAQCYKGECCLENCQIANFTNSEEMQDLCGFKFNGTSFIPSLQCDGQRSACTGWDSHCSSCGLIPTDHRSDLFKGPRLMTMLAFTDLNEMLMMAWGYLPAKMDHDWEEVDDGPFNGAIKGYSMVSQQTKGVYCNVMNHEGGFSSAAYFRPSMETKGGKIASTSLKDLSAQWEVLYDRLQNSDSFLLKVGQKSVPDSFKVVKLRWNFEQWNFLAVVFDLTTKSIRVHNETSMLLEFHHWNVHFNQWANEVQFGAVGRLDEMSCLTNYRGPIHQSEIKLIPSLCRSRALGNYGEKFKEPNRFLGRFFVKHQPKFDDHCLVKHDEIEFNDQGPKSFGSVKIPGNDNEPAFTWKCVENFVDSGFTLSTFLKFKKKSDEKIDLVEIKGKRGGKEEFYKFGIEFSNDGKMVMVVNDKKSKTIGTLAADQWNFIAIVYFRRFHTFEFYSQSGAFLGNVDFSFQLTGFESHYDDGSRWIVEEIQGGPFGHGPTWLSCFQIHWERLTALEIAKLPCHCLENEFCYSHQIESPNQIVNKLPNSGNLLGYWSLANNENIDEDFKGIKPSFAQHRLVDGEGIIYCSRNGGNYGVGKEIMAIYPLKHDNLKNCSLTISFWLFNNGTWLEAGEEQSVFLEIRNLISFATSSKGFSVKWKGGYEEHFSNFEPHEEKHFFQFVFDNIANRQNIRVLADNYTKINYVSSYRQQIDVSDRKANGQTSWDLILSPKKGIGIKHLSIYDVVLSRGNLTLISEIFTTENAREPKTTNHVGTTVMTLPNNNNSQVKSVDYSEHSNGMNAKCFCPILILLQFFNLKKVFET